MGQDSAGVAGSRFVLSVCTAVHVVEAVGLKRTHDRGTRIPAPKAL
jgi:hypothetical protein